MRADRIRRSRVFGRGVQIAAFPSADRPLGVAFRPFRQFGLGCHHAAHGRHISIKKTMFLAIRGRGAQARNKQELDHFFSLPMPTLLMILPSNANWLTNDWAQRFFACHENLAGELPNFLSLGCWLIGYCAKWAWFWPDCDNSPCL